MFFDETNNFFDIVENDYELEYVDKSKFNNTNINIDSINFNRHNDLYSPLEGFNKGNMFSGLYNRYKDHVYKLKVNNARDDLLYKIQMYSFAMKDLNLYLDLHPNDNNMLKEYQNYKNMVNELKKKYEKEYGPLCASDVSSTTKWTWLNNPWPWDKGGKY